MANFLGMFYYNKRFKTIKIITLYFFIFIFKLPNFNSRESILSSFLILGLSEFVILLSLTFFVTLD
jgi:hypothetical protein